MEARALMLRGVEELADAVKVTMGPKVISFSFYLLKDDLLMLKLLVCSRQIFFLCTI